MKSNNFLLCCLAILLTACGGGDEDPQPTSVGTISGTVSSAIDQSAVANAPLSISGKTANSTSDGSFELTNVPTGIAWLRVEASGFDIYAEQIQVQEGQNNHNVECSPIRDHGQSVRGAGRRHATPATQSGTVMRAVIGAICLVLSATAAWPNAQTDRLVDALGLPALIAAFSTEGIESGAALDAGLLNGQGGNVWAETVRRLYDPERLVEDVRAAFDAGLDPDVTAQALLFFESDLGQRLTELEVQARQAMLNPDLEDMAKSAPSAASDAISDFLAIRDLVARNADTSLDAQTAFFAGLADVTGRANETPDVEAQRDTVTAETERWLRGYYALAQSPLSADDVAIYTAFWDTDVGRALDDVLFEAFGTSYSTLSFGLGQTAGRLLPQNDL